MAKDFSTPNKICIRNNYNKKIIKYLKEKCGYNIIYFGLPSPEAHDIECWIEYISYVIAFQCRDYKQISTPDLPTDEIDKLIAKLNEWEAASKIEGYDVYDGFMEEVIFNGYDNSSSGSVPFKFENAVTLFNLDFCNKITTPQEYLNADGVPEKKYKFELIDKILEHQKQVSNENQGFVLFITINSGYDGEELSEYINANQESLKVYNTCSSGIKKQFVLKHFVAVALCHQYIISCLAGHLFNAAQYARKKMMNQLWDNHTDGVGTIGPQVQCHCIGFVVMLLGIFMDQIPRLLADVRVFFQSPRRRRGRHTQLPCKGLDGNLWFIHIDHVFPS